jgi:hypothetical protein
MADHGHKIVCQRLASVLGPRAAGLFHSSLVDGYHAEPGLDQAGHEQTKLGAQLKHRGRGADQRPIAGVGVGEPPIGQVNELL